MTPAPRYLRVGLELVGRAVRIASIHVVDRPDEAPRECEAPLYARVDIGGRTVLVQPLAEPEPRIAWIPFREAIELAAVRIRVAAVDDAPAGPDPMRLARAFDEPTAGLRPLGTIAAPDLEGHPDWVRVAESLGFRALPGCFEIHAGDDGRFSWILRGRDGRVMARGPVEHERREDCEQELRWVRERAAACHVRSTWA